MNDEIHRQDKLIRKHIFVNADDWKFFEDHFGGRNQIGTSKAVRICMNKFREALEAKASSRFAKVDASGIDLGAAE